MNNKPITYEDKMKDRDNEFLYNKCVKQYHCIMNYQSKMREYKERIKELEEENEKLKKDNDRLGELFYNRNEENIKLRKNINNAIEYIEHNDIMKVSKEEETKGSIFCCDMELLKILKGEKNGKL